jgi:NitT/TauT family transport system substrate-binding protein
MKHLSRRLLVQSILAGLSSLIGPGCKEKPAPETAAPAASTSAAAPAEPQVEDSREYKIGWSIWTGYMPMAIMEEKGFLAKRARENGVKVKLVFNKVYVDGIKAYTETKLDGVAMGSVEVLQPPSQGLASVAILVHNHSAGADGILVKNLNNLKDLKGQTVMLEELTVSHYLLARALEKAGLKESDVKLKNIPGDEAGKLFLTDKAPPVVATWDPFLFKAKEAGKGKIIFSSKDIPYEILDFLVVADSALKRSPGLGRALADAWFDACAFYNDPNTHAEAMRIMAKAGETTPEDFEKMLADAEIYGDRAKTVTFMGSDTLKESMEKVQRFAFEHKLIKDDRFKIGYGSGGWQKLRFDPSFIKVNK